ncbi:MAG: aminoacyl-histidine dipeptidase [Bacteroidota bacterium]
MENSILNLQPAAVWFYFNEICKIPHPSKKEEKMINYLVNFGKTNHLETLTDKVQNVLIRKPATKGYENKPSVCLQSHIDMVCEKNSNVQHDFETDSIKPVVDGEWVRAQGTTLGADDGIGMAVQLAILASDSIEHGPIECLFTVDEETGLTGAFALEPGFLKSNILLNLDSEDDGQLFIGCAGGKDTVATFNYKEDKNIPQGKAYIINVSGLKGGHSGDDINKGLGNSNKILNRILWNASKECGIRISEIDGGNLRNAIPREAFAKIIVPTDKIDSFIYIYKMISSNIKNELLSVEDNLNIELTETSLPETLIDETTQQQLLNALYVCPHGVIAMCADMPGLVETSTNLASIKMLNNEILVTSSQRSSIESAKDDIVDMVDTVFKMAGATTSHGDGYPGWKPNVHSAIMQITKDAYQRLFNVEPLVLAIHAGLECGLIGEKYPGMDMISFGPTLRGVHSPDEKLKIDTVERFWQLTLEVLKNIPA